ncbi:MAG: glycosidase, partial [Armatimonadetes bacterium]|nr:glycosidase [Armatimonadota bacterium]NIO74523.1 glycosidase [Armatimonadota bacterium]NIO98352.1 glycosidase [Armatimonadota bacterium]
MMALRIERFPENPLISPKHLKPSREGWEVVSTLNAGAVLHEREVLLLLRVAERPICDDLDLLVAPVLDFSSGSPEMRVLRVRKDDPEITGGDARLFTYRGQTFLTSISHLRLARSKDGRRFTVDDQPAFAPAAPHESFGVEDPRITEMEGRHLITYTAVSEHGIASALAFTEDFQE